MKRFLIGTVILALVTIGAFAQNAVSKAQAIEMVFVEGGTFQMGSNDLNDSKPVHDVTVSSFYIGKTEVTQLQWKAVMGNNPSCYNGDSRPVENVTWYDAIVFCNKLSIMQGKSPAYSVNGSTNPGSWDYESWDGKRYQSSNSIIKGAISMDMNANGYRLPTEAEWEYAARGGKKSKGYKYSGSNNLETVAWYGDNKWSLIPGDYEPQHHDVATKAPNELGLYDMSGNVWEWCWDWFGPYVGNAQTNPVGISSGEFRIMRGGAYYMSQGACRVDIRAKLKSDYGNSGGTGFRVVCSAVDD